jgi:phage gpG-like protein
MTGTVKIEPANMQEVQAALRKYGQRARDAIGQAVQATGLEITSDIKKRIQRGPKTGRTYKRRSVVHRASAPGQAPATDTGTLANSITFRKVDDLTAEIQSRLAYAPMLEFGTRMIAPRPSWVPAAEAARPKLQLRITTAIARLV